MNSLNSSSTNESLGSQGVQLSQVWPGIKRDVMTKCQEVEMRKMLQDILVECTNRPQESFDKSAKKKLLNDCLKKVTPPCDDNWIFEACNNSGMLQSCQIKNSLQEYANATNEKDLYPLFVTAANIALLFLQDLEIEHVRRADARRAVYFHVNDPIELTQVHQGHTLRHKPDVLLVSESDIPNFGDSVKNLLALTTKHPNDAFEWRSVRTFVEFKRSTKKMGFFPESYALPQEEDSPETTPKLSGSSYLKDAKMKCQAGYYAAEMFAAHTGRLHVIGLVIVDEMLHISRYDRQGVIQCSELDIIKDLQLFLVLLLAMQRFKDQHWGLNPNVDPNFGSQPKVHETTLLSDDGREISITLELSDKKRIPHYGLNGRAANLFSAKIKGVEDDLVVKVSWPEAVRISEPKILEKVYNIAKDNDEVRGHVPEVLWSKKFEDTSTAKIRERLGLTVTPGASRVLYMIVFRKLKPIIELDGDKFLCAWWATVKCHHVLWKNGIYHRDISPSNLMYYEDGEKIMGVLNNFDLASTEDSVTTTQRTGTVPFMAIDLLAEEAIRGEVKHSYEHDAESFIWVLLWISLQYEDGRLHGRHAMLDEWQKVDAVKCGLLRTAFLFGSWRTLEASKGHEENWELAKRGIMSLQDQAILKSRSKARRPLDIDTAFEELLNKPYTERP